MNGNPMYKARAALALHPAGRVDQRQGCLPPARSPRRFLPRSCGVERQASGLGSILNSVICAVFRGRLQWIPVPADPSEREHDDEHRCVGQYLFCAAVGLIGASHKLPDRPVRAMVTVKATRAVLFAQKLSRRCDCHRVTNLAGHCSTRRRRVRTTPVFLTIAR
jgi:hypothetical protein